MLLSPRRPSPRRPSRPAPLAPSVQQAVGVRTARLPAQPPSHAPPRGTDPPCPGTDSPCPLQAEKSGVFAYAPNQDDFKLYGSLYVLFGMLCAQRDSNAISWSRTPAC